MSIYSSGGLVRTFPQYLDENNITSYRQESVIQRIDVPRFEPLMLELRHCVDCVRANCLSPPAPNPSGGMKPMKHSNSLVALAIGLGLTLALLCILRGPSDPALAETGLAPTPPSLARQHDPVVITGGLLSDLAGTPLHDVFVYAYRGTALAQIPFQIDERDGNGTYVPVEDGHLDDNDELVFMAMDGGGRVDSPSLDVGGTSITPTYVITLTDPLSDTHAWAYVFKSGDITYSVTADYVSYDDGNDRVISPGRYSFGFSTTHAFRNYLTLGDSSLNLLDRDKVRVAGMITMFPVSADEEDVAKRGVHAIDGPVRVTRVSTAALEVETVGTLVTNTATLFAYHSLAVQLAPIEIPGGLIQITYQRVSMDWNEQAVGMVYYDANNPAGVTIVGNSEIITAPPTRWTQVTGVTGTVVSVSQIPAGLEGTQSTYYKDDGDFDAGDTGDHRSYGDAGLQVYDPNPGSYTVLGQTYFLTEATANVGATYAGYYDNPLQVSVTTFIPSKRYVYLPLVAKGY
jgi:hypothetical protein